MVSTESQPGTGSQGTGSQGTGSQTVSTQQCAREWTSVECSEIEYEHMLSCLQEDGEHGHRSPEAVAAILRTMLHRLEAATMATVRQQIGEQHRQEVRPLSPRVWWRLTRPE